MFNKYQIDAWNCKMNTIYKEGVMKKLKEGGSLVETCFFGEPVFLRA